MKTNTLYRHGFALGKFLPLHQGHEALINFGIQSSQSFTVMLCALPSDPIPGKVRLAWMQRLFPTAHIAYLDDPTMPQEPKNHPDFWQIWRNAIKKLVAEDIDAVFASETYGWRLADELKAEFMPFDIGRTRFPVSGTAVRGDPLKYWQYLSKPVRAYYIKRIAILGPESAGKSTLAAQLASHYDTEPVIEYARPLFDAYVDEGRRAPGEFRLEDLTQVARGQRALEETLAESSNGVLICDTDVLTTMTWSQYLYGTVEPHLEAIAKQQTYDLTLVLHPADNQFVADGQRVMSDYQTRLDFFEQLCANLRKVGRPYQVVRGTHNERLAEAITLIEAIEMK